MKFTPERRRYPRFGAWLPLRLKVVGGKVQHDPPPLVTQNLSKSGLCFPAPHHIAPGQSIEAEVTFLGAGLDGNNIKISGIGHIVRAESAKQPGWYKLAATFDEPPSCDEIEWQKLVAAFHKKS
jgi:hypothetical protein